MQIVIDSQSKTFRTFFTLSLFLFSFILLGSATYSWTNPTGTAPNNNVAAPVNVGSTSQIKDGPLQVNGLLNVGSTALQGALTSTSNITSDNNIVAANRLRTNGDLCIGSDCRTDHAPQCVTRTSTGNIGNTETRTATCNSGEVVTGGSCYGSPWHDSTFTANGYRCRNRSADVYTVTASARCCQ